MIVPLAVALVVEISLDPTSHNLFPFEIVLVWAPAFLLSWGAGAIALTLAPRRPALTLRACNKTVRMAA